MSRCVSCGRFVETGDAWCPGNLSGYECATDLRDSNNVVYEYLPPLLP